MRSTSERALLAMFAAALSASCQAAPTELVVVVDTDYEVPSELGLVRAITRSRHGEIIEQHDFVLGRGDGVTASLYPPFSFAILPLDGDTTRQFTVEIEAHTAAGGRLLFVRRAQTGFVRGRLLRLPMFLARQCETTWTQCAQDETCTEFGCQPRDVAPASLAPIARGGELPTGMDAGAVEDAQLGDAGACEPSVETCNGRDDDCDGSTDERTAADAACSQPHTTAICEMGRCMITACETNFADCDHRPENGCEEALNTLSSCGGCMMPCRADHATTSCYSGTCEVLSCETGFFDFDHMVSTGCEQGCNPSGAELCNGHDDDCSGVADDGDPALLDATCPFPFGSGHCVAGHCQLSGCIAGFGDCNGMDMDGCESPLDNELYCGSCTTPCPRSADHRLSVCNAGSCGASGCEAGYVDFDGMASNGCEYACSYQAPNEICDGRDQDCDTRIDEGLVAPAYRLCPPYGVCAASPNVCAASMGWICALPPAYDATESRCDGMDGDCDGRTDETFPLHTACDMGIGGCRRVGVTVCAVTGDAVACNATAGSPMTEIVNGIDDDCNGMVDETAAALTPQVSVTASIGGTVGVGKYEASHPDASPTGQGSLTNVAATRAGVIPWTGVTPAQAEAACASLGTGFRLCDLADLQTACRGISSCSWAYMSSCTTSAPATCNLDAYDTDAVAAGDQDATIATGSLANCFANFPGTNDIYDITGNAAEWTHTTAPGGYHWAFGGMASSLESGSTCGTAILLPDAYIHPLIGFRCCHY